LKRDILEGMKDEFVEMPFDDSERGTGTPQHFQQPKRRIIATGLREDVCSLVEGGSALVRWPEHISKASAEDLLVWLDFVKQKIKRAAETTLAAEDTYEGDEDHPKDL
jgi:hypothetical protein